jgi:hypothetical protein
MPPSVLCARTELGCNAHVRFWPKADIRRTAPDVHLRCFFQEGWFALVAEACVN